MAMLKNLFFLTLFLAIAVPSVQDHYGFSIFNDITIYPFEITLFFGLFMYMISILSGRVKIAKSPLNIPLIFFLLILVAWTIMGIQRYDLRASLYDVKSLFYYLIFFWGLSVIKSKQDIINCIKIWVLAIGVYSVILLFEFFIKSGSMWITRPEFLQGTNRIGSSNGLLITLIVPFVIFLYHKTKQWTLMVRICLLSLIVILPLSQSRIQLFIIFCILLLSLFIKFKQKKFVSSFRLSLLLIVLGSTSLVYIFFSPFFMKRLLGLFNLGLDSSFMTRYLTTVMTLDKIRESPFIGYGFGGLIFESSAETRGTILDLTNYFIDNSWLTIVYKVGIIGGLVFIILWYKTLQNIIRIKTTDEWFKNFKVALLITVISIFMLSIANIFLVRGQLIVFLSSFLVIAERIKRLSRFDEGRILS